jgi:hypothetical protein
MDYRRQLWRDGRAAAQERDDANGRAKYVGEDEVAAQVARHGVLVDHRIDDAGDDEAEDHHELNYAVEDARLADTIVLWGANSYETSTVFFVDHMLPNLQRGMTDEKSKGFRPQGAGRGGAHGAHRPLQEFDGGPGPSVIGADARWARAHVQDMIVPPAAGGAGSGGRLPR